MQDSPVIQMQQCEYEFSKEEEHDLANKRNRLDLPNTGVFSQLEATPLGAWCSTWARSTRVHRHAQECVVYFGWIEYPLKPREDVLSLSDCTVQYTPDVSSMYWTVTVFPRTLFSIQVYSSTLLYLLRNSASNSFFSIVSFLRSVLGRKSYLLPYKSAQYLANCQTHGRNIYSSS